MTLPTACHSAGAAYSARELVQQGHTNGSRSSNLWTLGDTIRTGFFGLVEPKFQFFPVKLARCSRRIAMPQARNPRDIRREGRRWRLLGRECV
jgi:hypothetical protein